MDRFTEEQIKKGMFSSDQVDYMRYLASLPPEAKCDCGWYRRGECYGVQDYGHPERGGAPRYD